MPWRWRGGDDHGVHCRIREHGIPFGEAFQPMACTGLIQSFLAWMPKSDGFEPRVGLECWQVDRLPEPQAGDGDADGWLLGGLRVHESGQISSADRIDHTFDQSVAASRFPLRAPTRQTIHLLVAE